MAKAAARPKSPGAVAARGPGRRRPRARRLPRRGACSPTTRASLGRPGGARRRRGALARLGALHDGRLRELPRPRRAHGLGLRGLHAAHRDRHALDDRRRGPRAHRADGPPRPAVGARAGGLAPPGRVARLGASARGLRRTLGDVGGLLVLLTLLAVAGLCITQASYAGVSRGLAARLAALGRIGRGRRPAPRIAATAAPTVTAPPPANTDRRRGAPEAPGAGHRAAGRGGGALPDARRRAATGAGAAARGEERARPAGDRAAPGEERPRPAERRA